MLEAGEVEQRVRNVVKRVAKLANADFSADADLFRELGVESVAALELLVSLEEEFSIEIPDAAFNDARTVRALVTVVEGLT